MRTSIRCNAWVTATLAALLGCGNDPSDLDQAADGRDPSSDARPSSDRRDGGRRGTAAGAPAAILHRCDAGLHRVSLRAAGLLLSPAGQVVLDSAVTTAPILDDRRYQQAVVLDAAEVFLSERHTPAGQGAEPSDRLLCYLR